MSIVQKTSSLPKSASALPTALFVGPQKAGTSWIHEYLHARGDVCLPEGVKETFFFDDRFDRKSLEWYTSHFKRGSHHRQVIEVAPTYFHSIQATERIATAVGLIPILVTLRDPVRRSYSLYLHLKRYGFTDQPLRKAVVSRPEILESSRYAQHLERWFRTFSRSLVHVLFQEELATEPERVVCKIDQLLELDPLTEGFDYQRRVNEAAAPRSGKLAGFMRRAGDLLRDYRLYWPIELAKKLGAKQLVYSGGRDLEKLSEEDGEWLRQQLGDESRRLRDLLMIDRLPWESRVNQESNSSGADQ